jgi:mRNA-degrading endonuclease RelE of RelBE toxin-antitoxin system
MPFDIILAPEAAQVYRKLSARLRAIVRSSLVTHLRHEPEKLSRSRSRSQIKRLRGIRKPQYRLRVEDLRIFYDVQEDRVEVLAIVSKSDASIWLEELGIKS